VQPRHALLKSVPDDVSIKGKLVISDHSRQYCEKLVTAP